MTPRSQRILHVDGDAFFASCEIALDPSLKEKSVFVGGGRRGDGIVIAANYRAKKYGITTGMACFEAKRKCPDGVLVKPHYDEYRRLSIEMFRRVRQYTPLLVPTSIDEGFLDFTDSPRVFKCQTPSELVTRMKREIEGEVGIPVTMGLGSSRYLAKLATDRCKPNGFLEVPQDNEKAFLHDIPVETLTGIGKRRAQSLHALQVWTFGDLAAIPLGMLEKHYGFLGLELWLLANGQLREQLSLANKPRTCIGSSTTLPYDEPDYESALLFLQAQTERVITTFFRENLKAWEMSVSIKFKDFSGAGRSVRFAAPLFEPRLILPVVEKLFHEIVRPQVQPIRQVCINFWNLQPLDLEPDLFGYKRDYQQRELHRAMEKLEGEFGKQCVKTGTRVLLEQQAQHLISDQAKCPFIPQREMEIKMNRVPEEVLDPSYEDEWQPLEAEDQSETLGLPRTRG